MIQSTVAYSKTKTNEVVSQEEGRHGIEKYLESDKNSNNLRPNRLDDYIGQKEMIKQLRMIIDSSKLRGQLPAHMLFYGQPGLGKTTIASLLASELSCGFKVISAPALQKIGDIVSLLLNCEENSVVFIDEIHRLKAPLEETLYSAMEDRKIDLLIGKGNGTNSVRMDLPAFVLIGATTQLGKISKPLTDRFPYIFHLTPYSQNEMLDLVSRSCKLLNLKLNEKAMRCVCSRSRGVPRIANNLLLRLVDLQAVTRKKTISGDDVNKYFDEIGIYENGLMRNDYRYLEVLLSGVFGLKSISDILQENPETVEQVIEPHLTHLGLIIKSSGGRQLSQKGSDLIRSVRSKIL